VNMNIFRGAGVRHVKSKREELREARKAAKASPNPPSGRR